MPECVGIDMGQMVALAELVQPIGHAVWVHGLSVVLREYETLVLVILAQPHPLFILPCPVLPQKLHCLRWEGDKPL